MRLKTLTTGLLIGLLAGCSGTKQGTKVQYPLEGQLSYEPRLTEPTTIPAQTQIAESPTILVRSNLSVPTAAKLTPKQIKQLISINNVKISNKITFKVILPTYIPSGFKVKKFSIRVEKYITEYEITYLNSSNSCFSITGSSGSWGDAPSDNDTVEVYSPALGKVVLEYGDFNRGRNAGFVAFGGGVVYKDGISYNFSSPGWHTDSCSSISLQEAIKIVKSLQYLNP